MGPADLLRGGLPAEPQQEVHTPGRAGAEGGKRFLYVRLFCVPQVSIHQR